MNTTTRNVFKRSRDRSPRHVVLRAAHAPRTSAQQAMVVRHDAGLAARQPGQSPVNPEVAALKLEIAIVKLKLERRKLQLGSWKRQPRGRKSPLGGLQPPLPQSN